MLARRNVFMVLGNRLVTARTACFDRIFLVSNQNSQYVFFFVSAAYVG